MKRSGIKTALSKRTKQKRSILQLVKIIQLTN